MTPLVEGNYIPYHPKLVQRLGDGGVRIAILLSLVHSWLEHNRKHNTNLHDGRTWTFDPVHKWADRLGWSVKTTQRTFKRAEQAGLLDVGNYNRRKYDRTHWYTINYDALQRLMKDGTGTADASPEQGSAPGDEGSGSSAAGAQIGDKPVPKSGPSRGQVVPHHEVKMVKPIPERTSLQDKPDEHSDQRHVSSLLERLAEEHRRSRAKLVEYGSSGLAGTDQWTEEQMRRVSLITKLTCEAAADVFGDVNLADTLEKVTRVADRVQLAGVDLHPMDACDILDRYRRAQSLSPIQP